jgi:hypothetical protein
MSKTTFWGSKGSTRRRIGGLVNDRLTDLEVNHFGVRFIETVNNQATRWVPWAELHRLASSPIEVPGMATMGPAIAATVALNPADLNADDKEFRVHPLQILPVEDES